MQQAYLEYLKACECLAWLKVVADILYTLATIFFAVIKLLSVVDNQS